VDNSFGFEEKQKAAARWKRDGFLSNAGCCFLGYATYYLLTTICGAVCSSCHPFLELRSENLDLPLIRPAVA